MYGCESWTKKKTESRRIDPFELWCWRRLLRVPWTARRSNQSILKEISPGCSLEGLMLKLKLQYFGHLMWKHHLTVIWKDPDAGKDWRQEEKGMREDEMVGWHYQLNGHELEYTSGVGDGQGGLAYCSPWSCKESDTTEWLNWTDIGLKGLGYNNKMFTYMSFKLNLQNSLSILEISGWIQMLSYKFLLEFSSSIFLEFL